MFSIIIALIGIAAVASLVPLLDAFAYANREGGMMLVVSLMLLVAGLGIWLIVLAWRLFRR